MNKKIVSLMLCALLACGTVSVFTGCSDPDDGGEKIDPNRTQLYVGNFNGGMRDDWLREMDNAFEAAYPEYQVIIDNAKDQFTGQQLDNNIKTNRQDMYFTTDADYFQFTAKGHYADITDVVTGKFENIDGTMTSIEDKMEPTLRKYFQKDDGKYYAIPFFTAISGFMYDRDLLIENRMLRQDGEGNWIGLERYSTQLGTDGIQGTEDDGLPATFEDFKIFLQQLRSRGIIPFTWCNTFPYYRITPLKAIVANYEGYDNYLLNYSFNGTHSVLGEITPKNGYKLQDIGGKAAALTFAKEVMSNEDNYSKQAFYATQSHIAAQEEFVQSAVSRSGKPIAMLFEGSWWENEARPVFSAMEKEYGEKYAYGKRNFGFLPIPRFEGQPNSERTLYSDLQSSVFISAYSKKIDIAKKFLRFTTTNEALAVCTRWTGVVRPYKYTIGEEDLQKMTPFGRSMWNAYNDPKAKLVTSYNLSDVRMNENSLYFTNWDFGANIGGNLTTDPITAFKLNSNVSVADYLKQCKELYNESTWNKQFGF